MTFPAKRLLAAIALAMPAVETPRRSSGWSFAPWFVGGALTAAAAVAVVWFAWPAAPTVQIAVPAGAGKISGSFPCAAGTTNSAVPCITTRISSSRCACGGCGEQPGISTE